MSAIVVGVKSALRVIGNVTMIARAFARCVAWLIKDPALDVAKLRLLEPCPEPVRQQALAVIAAHPTLDVDPKRLKAFAHCRPEVPGHADVFFRDLLGSAERVLDDESHLRAALDWPLQSRAVTGSDGFAAAYSFTAGWLPPYPETTGYVIPTLFEAHAVHEKRFFTGSEKSELF